VIHRAEVHWTASGDVARGQYSRGHTWTVDGGLTLPASASPDIVPLPYADPAAIDPEEAFVASVASCHMLSFLDLARRDGYTAASYHDQAEGRMAKNKQGLNWIEEIILNIRVTWSGTPPDRATHDALHHAAHRVCFIANSVRTRITPNIIEG
jgi:organic hydroperoxide reductase OsmC/OhrA